MILEIDDDFSDQVVVTVLADSYVSMQSIVPFSTFCVVKLITKD